MHQLERKILFGVNPPAVTHLRKIGTLVLLLASFLTPTLACAVADTPMTSEERACCQMMKSQCGEKGMPASHGCCHRIPGSIYDNALKAKAVALHPLAVPVIWLPVHQLEDSNLIRPRMGRTACLHTSEVPTFDDLHSKNLALSAFGLCFRLAHSHVCAKRFFGTV